MSLDPAIGDPIYTKRTFSYKIKEILEHHEEIKDLITDCIRLDKDRTFFDELRGMEVASNLMEQGLEIIIDRVG